MKLHGAAKKQFLARMARGRARRRKNPAHQLQLGGQLVDMHGRAVWAGDRKGPRAAAPTTFMRKIFGPSEADLDAAEMLTGKSPSYSYPRERKKDAKARRLAQPEIYGTAGYTPRQLAAMLTGGPVRKKKAKPHKKASHKAKPHKKAKHKKLTGAAATAFLKKLKKKAKPHKKAKHKKLTGAAKKAFVARMAAGRRGWKPKTAKQVYRAQHRKGVKHHYHALESIGTRSKVAGRITLNPRTGELIMTKVANPKKRKNRRRNPSVRGALRSLKSAAMPMAVGGIAGLSAGYMDAKWLGTKPTVSILAKIGLAVLGAALIGEKSPLAAAGWAGGLIGSTGYHAGVSFGGGMVGLSPAGALKGIADMAADDPEMASLIAGLGDVVDDNGMADAGDDAAAEYNQALADSDDEMAEIVEDAA